MIGNLCVKFLNKFRIGNKIVAACFVTVLLGFSVAQSQTVTIQSLDGTVSMIGELQSYDGEFFVLKTRIGEVSVRVDGVNCIGDGCPELDVTPRFAIAGSNTIGLVLMPSLLTEYAAANKFLLTETVALVTGQTAQDNHFEYVFEDPTGNIFADVTIDSNGADTAFGALLSGDVEFVMSSRAVRSDEIAAFQAGGLGDLSSTDSQTIIALDGLIILVARTNPVSALTIGQIASIFSGDITNWQEIGGPDQQINVYRRDSDAGTTNDFVTNVLASRRLAFSDNAIVAKTDTELSALVARDPFGIGFTGFAFENNARAVSLRDTCGFPIAPTEFSIKTGEYPLSRRLYLYTSNQRFTSFSEARAGQIQSFLTFVLSDVAQKAVAESGFVDQTITVLPIDRQGQRLANALAEGFEDASYSDLVAMVEDFQNAERLSTTFRFRDDNPVLDSLSTQNIARLSAYLTENDLSDKEIVFAGFTDSLGQASENRKIAQNRAERALLLVSAFLGSAADGVDMRATGYGEIAPLTCNNSVFGRAINQRVEVWIRDRS